MGRELILVWRITNSSLRPEECLEKELCRKIKENEWDRKSACMKLLSKNDEGIPGLLIDSQNNWRMEIREE